MKDDLPDLTPYLSKKGGNSQGKGADNSAGKADISSKLSALVKKTGTFSAEDSDALVDSPASTAAPESAPQSASASNSSSVNAVASSSSWEQVDSFSSTARLEAQAEALAQEKMFAQAAAGLIEESDYAPYGDNAAAVDQAPSVVAQQSSPEFSPPSNAEINSDSSGSSSQSGTFSTSGNFSTSGTFTTKPMASRPGGPAPSLDKFKAPQARPMNTLSSGTPPVLKIPEKEAVRPPAPYTFHQPSEAPREAVVPKSMQLPTPSTPTTSTPGPSAQAKRAAEVSKDPPPSWPAQPTSPPRIVEKVEKVEKIEKIENKVEPQPQPSPRKQIQPESTAELLAKAFAEEAKALEQNSDDMLEPLSPLEQYNFSSEQADQFNNEQVAQPSSDTDYDAKYDSPYFEPKPKGLVGFGSLLGGGSPEPSPADADSAAPGHSNLADLMIPTGEHQALFAPERRDQEGVSPFDEVHPEAFSDNSANYSDATLTTPEPVRVDERSAPPAFSSLFSTEIVTSGQDYSFQGAKPSEPVGDTQPQSSDFSQAESQPSFASAEPFAESFAESFTEPASEPSGVLSQSDAISKLLAAVNQEQQSNMSSDLASSFADPSFTESNFGEVEDMRTADTMFGSGGSNKGSAEELSAADAVFGAVPELAAPVLEPPSPEPAKAPVSSSAFPEQPVLGKDSLPIAFANAENFEQESLESIKIGIRKAKAEEKARKKAEEEAKLAAEQSAAAAKADEVIVESYSEPISEPVSQPVSQVAEEPAKSESQSPKSTAKLSLTEMIELANSAKLEQVQDGKPAQAEEPAKSGLASLLSSTNFDEPVSRAPSKPAVDEEDDDGDSLGGAISDALDKLLAAGQEEQSQVAESQPQVAPSSSPSQNRLEAFASTSNQVEDEAPLTQTQANKVDALSRLLEVASKAPNKSPEDKRTPSDSASKIAAEINKPPGRVSRQVETIQASDYNQQPNQGAAMSSPFGGSSPFSSPFNSPSTSQTRPASQEQTPSTSGTGMANPYDGVASMPQATVSNDAVSARIAALNRKLEEQNRPPSASAVNMEALAQIQQQAELQAQSQSPVQSSGQSSVGTGTGSVPSVNSLSQLPPQVDDSPSTRAELVNRILGSAKISQQGTKMPELPTRTVAETITPEQTAAIRGGKGNSQGPGRTRTRVAKMPGIDLRPIMAIVALLVVVGGGGFYAYQSGIVKFNLPDAKPGAETKASIDQMIKNGELDRAREILEGKVSSGKITASEGEKLHSIYFQMANKVDDEDPAEAVKLLEKIPSRSKKFKDAQKLLRKLKRKVKKN